jgi:hypothetical protein
MTAAAPETGLERSSAWFSRFLLVVVLTAGVAYSSVAEAQEAHEGK